MKNIIAIACAGLLTISSALAGEPSQADQKWLTVVEQKVAKGDTTISTPSQERANLLKEWAGKHSYTATVTKSDAGYQIELSKSLAKN